MMRLFILLAALFPLLSFGVTNLTDRVVYTGTVSDPNQEGAYRSSDQLYCLLVRGGTALFTTPSGVNSSIVLDAANPTPFGTAFVTNELWIGYVATVQITPGNFGPECQLRRYSLTGFPPTTAALLETKVLSTNTDARIFGLYHSTSGATFCFLHYQTGVQGPPGDWPKVFDVFFQNPSGTWITNRSQFSISNPGQIESVAQPVPILQHPSDGAIWSFWNRDSSHRIQAFRITESAGNYTVSNTYSNLISTVSDGNLDGPDGELTAIKATKVTGAIRLAYPRFQTDFFIPGPPTWRGAQVTFADINSAGSRTFSYGPTNLSVYSGLGDPPSLMWNYGVLYGLFRPVISSGVFQFQPPQLYAIGTGSWTNVWTKTLCSPQLGMVRQMPDNRGIFYYDCPSQTMHLLEIDTNGLNRTFYIDYENGNDLNSGTATNAAWKRHPYMRNWGGTYSHQAGDTFYFKGGVTWPNVCFTMQIMSGGTPGAIDHYSYDTNWYTGGSWSRPIFDAEGMELAGGYDVMVLFNLMSPPVPNNVVIDGIEFKRLYWNGPKSFSQVSFVNLSQSTNIVVNNCYFHNWTHGTYAAGTRDDLKCIVGSNSNPFNPGCIVQDCTFDGENATNATNGSSSGEGTYAYSGNVYDSTFRNMTSGTIVTGPAGGTVPQIVSGCHIGPVYVSFDQDVHTDGIFMNGGSVFYWHDNYIHDCAALSIFCGNGSGPEHTYIWNNLIYNTAAGNPPVVVDNPIAPSCHVFMWNNTFVGGNNAAIRVQNRNNLNLASLDIRNNFAISDAGLLTVDPGVSITALTNQNNLTLSVASASVQGYSLANLYQPTAAAAPTVNAGQNLAGIFAPFPGPDILGVTRPQGSAWDISAYEFLGASGTPGVLSLSSSAFSVNQGAFSTTTATRSGGTAGAVSVSVATANGTAVAGIDYSPINSTFSWADGATGARSLPLTILSSGASVDKTFTITISSPTGGASLGPITTTTVTILGTIPQPPTNGGTFTFTSASFATTETSGSTVITVQRTGGTNLAASVNFFTQDSSAVSGFDYTGISGTLSWTANENGVKTFTIPILNTGTPSGTKSFNVKLTAPTVGSALAIPNSAVVTITMNATPIPGSIALSTPGTTVPQSGGSVLISVMRAGGTNNAVTVLASTANVTATAGVDYTATSQTLSWADGEGGVKTMLVPIINSGIQSATDRSFTVNLSAVTGGATIGSPSTEIVTILMPRPLQGGTIAITTNLFNTSLAAGSVTVTINRSGSANAAGSVQYQTVNGTAAAGTDYLATSGTLNWSANDNSTKTITVPILNTGASGPNRTFSFQIFNPSSGVTLGLTNSTVSIALNPVVIPGVIRLTSSSTNVNQNGGSVQICATRTSGTNGVVTVLGTTFNGTATAAVDYTAVTQTLTWANGEGGTKCLTVPIINSGIVSATDRTFTLGLTNVTGGATIGSPSNEVVTIIMPKPAAGSIALSQSSYSVSETNGSLTITVFRTGSTNVAASVHYSTQNGSAVAGFDYTTTVGDLTWGVNDNTPRTFLIPILNTGSVGPNRVFRVNLTNATGSNLGSPGSALISIKMDAIITLQGAMTIGGRVTLGGSMVLGGH